MIVLSGPARPGAPMPTLVPPVAGSGRIDGAALTFIPSDGYVPWSKVRVYVPSALARAKHWSFSVGPPPILRVQQLLAELHYLPLRFVPTAGPTGPGHRGGRAGQFTDGGLPRALYFADRDLQLALPRGARVAWRHFGRRARTTSSPTGAIMHFEDDANLTTDGLVEPQVWQALDASHRHARPRPCPL